jgi:hypothetical protein
MADCRSIARASSRLSTRAVLLPNDAILVGGKQGYLYVLDQNKCSAWLRATPCAPASEAGNALLVDSHWDVYRLGTDVPDLGGHHASANGHESRPFH